MVSWYPRLRIACKKLLATKDTIIIGFGIVVIIIRSSIIAGHKTHEANAGLK